MQQAKFKNNSVMVSFDVKSLFTNIPVDFVTDIISKEFYGSDSTKKVYGLTKRQFKNLLVWTTKRTTQNFNRSFYEQIDGVGMGSPIAPAFADIFMNWVSYQNYYECYSQSHKQKSKTGCQTSP